MHRIRLHGPWEYEPLQRAATPGDVAAGAATGLPPPGVLTIPADWTETLGADFRGRVRYTRRFHRPTGLDEGQRVFLCVERVANHGTVSLNGDRLGVAASRGGPFRFDVSRRLVRYNSLVIEIESLDGPGGLTGSVRLEIAGCTNGGS